MRSDTGARRRLVVLAALVLLSAWLCATLLLEARADGLSWSGTDGPYLGDQMQYLGWVRDARDGLIGDPFVLEPRPERFLHPGLAVSGLLVIAGWLLYRSGLRSMQDSAVLTEARRPA